MFFLDDLFKNCFLGLWFVEILWFEIFVVLNLIRLFRFLIFDDLFTVFTSSKREEFFCPQYNTLFVILRFEICLVLFLFVHLVLIGLDLFTPMSGICILVMFFRLCLFLSFNDLSGKSRVLLKPELDFLLRICFVLSLENLPKSLLYSGLLHVTVGGNFVNAREKSALYRVLLTFPRSKALTLSQAFFKSP
uniref:Uncharacterized protein n=2 Tax=Cacopsylla melanoneura TaxID=428564 RepID=A0A8D9AL98_9HEMI